jgi:hypothetical protein
MEKIKHGELIVYKTHISNVDSEKIMEESNMIWNLKYPDAHDLVSFNGPGIQFRNYTLYNSATSKLIYKISDKVIDLYKSLNGDISPLILINPWIFISTKYNKSTNWHDHIEFIPGISTIGEELKTTFTSTCYINVPEIEEESILYLKENNDTPDEHALSLYPSVGDVFLFLGETPHMPVIPKKSKNTRYVLGINFYFSKMNIKKTEAPKPKLF